MSRGNVPAFRVMLDGQDLTARFRPRLLSLTLTEKRGDEADQLDIVIDDSRGDMALPREGVALLAALGWASGPDVAKGLVDKGRFVVDEVQHSGPPDQITIRARAADFTSAIRTRREASWSATSLGAVIADIAGRNGLQARCAPALASMLLPTLVQSRESDAALLRRLGRENDAVATIKHGALIFAPIGAGITPRGLAIPSATIRRRDGDRHTYRIEKRDEVSGVTASWHDRDSATKKHVRAGSAGKTRALSRTYPDEASARQAAGAELSRAGRAPVRLELSLALGRPDLYPERAVAVQGFKPAIDVRAWRITEVTHRLSKDEGFRTGLTLEGAK